MANLTPLPRFYEVDANGAPLAGGKLLSYEPGTLVPKATYTTQTGAVANPNPVLLGADGRADVWLEGAYRLILTDAQDVQVYDVDNVNVSQDPFTAINTTLRTAQAGVGIEEAMQTDVIPANIMSPVKVLDCLYSGQSGIPGANNNIGLLKVNGTTIFSNNLGAGTLPTQDKYQFGGQMYMRDTTLSIFFNSLRAEITPFDASAGFTLTFAVTRDNAGNVIQLDASTVTIT